MTIKGIQDKTERGEYRFSDHAVKRMIKKSIDRHEVEEALLGGEIVEDILTISIPQAVLFMARREKEEICMSMFRIHLRLWSLQLMNQIRKSGLTGKPGGDLR